MKGIDRINTWVGRVVSWFIPANIAVMFIGVVARYLFNTPLPWPDELSLHLYGSYLILGGGYAFLKGQHVRVDIIRMKLSPRTQAVIDVVTFPVFISFTGVLLWKGVEMSWASTLLQERSNSEWNSLVWPIKWMIPIGAFLLLAQGISKFRNDLVFVFQKKKQNK
jgi:TRAP-type mannitol/chloroaromatic compound transport system permease small subunit